MLGNAYARRVWRRDSIHCGTHSNRVTLRVLEYISPLELNRVPNVAQPTLMFGRSQGRVAAEWRCLLLAVHQSAHDAIPALIQGSFDPVLLAVAALHEGTRLGDANAALAASSVRAAADWKACCCFVACYCIFSPFVTR